MCTVCFSRRSAMGLFGMGLASVAAATMARAADGPKSSLTPEQALAALKEGNQRYVSTPQLCAIDLDRRRADTEAGQAPWATILSCADSRVPPELLFGGKGVGELFVARNAGNLADTAVLGTLEYGAAVLGSPLIVVLGHEKCGAVVAACDVVTKNATYPGSIGPMIEPIVPSAIAMKDKGGDFVANTIRESALRTAKRLVAASPIIGEMVKSGKVMVVAAHYGLKDGKVDFLT